MKSVLAIIGVLSLAAFTIFAEDTITAKFTRIICTVYDKELIVNETCSIKPINRNTAIVNVYGFFTRQVYAIETRIQLFKKLNIVYKPFLVDVKENFCHVFTKQSSAPYLKILLTVAGSYTNLNHSCPYIGDIFIKDLAFDAANLRGVLWPIGEYRVDITAMANKSPSPGVLIQFFGELKEKIKG